MFKLADRPVLFAPLEAVEKGSEVFKRTFWGDALRFFLIETTANISSIIKLQIGLSSAGFCWIEI